MPNHPLDETQLQALLRLKRHEQPPPGYFDDLLHGIHRRQREELLRRPGWLISLERLRTFFAPLRVDWAHAASMAALLVLGIAVIRVALPDRVSERPQLAGNANAIPGQRLVSEPMLTLDSSGLAGLTAGADKRAALNQAPADPDAPTRFIIDTQPVSYETKQFRF